MIKIKLIKQFKNKSGFSLVELLVVISIISLLTTVIVARVHSVNTKSRDLKRVNDINELIRGIEVYVTQNGEYPGESDLNEVVLSPSCSSDLKSDLLSKGIFNEIPFDSFINNTPSGCAASSWVDVNDEYFYGFDADHEGGDICVSINRLETTWAANLLIEKYGQLQSVTSGAAANINNAHFNYCFEAASYLP